MYLGLMILVGSIVVATVNSNNSDNPNTDQENNKKQTTTSDLVISEKNTKSDNLRHKNRHKKNCRIIFNRCHLLTQTKLHATKH